MDIYKFMHMDNKTYDDCLEAVKSNEWAIQFVPDELLTEELYLEAVKQNGSMLAFVKKQTPAICMSAVEAGGYFERMWGSGDDYEVDHIVSSYSNTLHLPDNYEVRSEYNYQIFEKVTAPVLSMVEDEFKTPEMCAIALEKAIESDNLARAQGPDANRCEVATWNFVPQDMSDRTKEILDSKVQLEDMER